VDVVEGFRRVKKAVVAFSFLADFSKTRNAIAADIANERLFI
jgi:hypothetical protein